MKLVLITFVNLKVKREKDMYVTFKALLDSGASCTLASEAKVCHLKKTKNDIASFKTAAWNFSTNQRCRAKMTLAEFNPTSEITHSVHVAKTLGNFNIIIVQNPLHELGIKIRFSTKTMFWNDVEVGIKNCVRKRRLIPRGRRTVRIG